MIRYERTQRTVLAMCVHCGAREIFTYVAGQEAAERWAMDHVQTAHPAHPDQEAFYRNARVRAHRRAKPD